MKRLKYLLPLLLILFALTTHAVDLRVDRLELRETDLTAQTQPVLDSNDVKCALVKVVLPLDNCTFEGSVAGTPRLHVNTWWVYMPGGSRQLTVNVPGGKPLRVDLTGDGRKDGLQSGLTYLLELSGYEVQQSGSAVADPGANYLILDITPKTGAMVRVDGKITPVEDGQVVTYLKYGPHSYIVEADGYARKEGTVTIGRGESVNVPVKLESVMASLTVKSATPGAEIKINGQKKGTGSWTGSMPEGLYRIDVTKDGYRPYSETVELAQRDNRVVEVAALTAITGALNVAYRPVGSTVTVDGKEVGKTPKVVYDLLEGRHNVTISKDGYESATASVNITEGTTAELTGSLKEMPRQQPVAQQSSTVASNSPGVETFTVKGVSFEMVKVDGGTFMMGSNDGDEDEKPVHSETVKTFYIGKTEVTQALWEAVMGSNPSNFKGSSNPVEKVSWNDCQEFIRKLNALTGKNFRLPTEAEWEYAARGGNRSRGYKYSGSNNISDVACYAVNSRRTPHPVGTKQANELGLYDMSGNVWEWCADKWCSNYSSPRDGSRRVYRGGSWNSDALSSRVARRGKDKPDYSYNGLGFRLAL